MNKDLRKVVILLAHPNIKASQANKALIDAVSDIEGVAVFNLYELSEDIAFNVDEWSKIISDTSAVIAVVDETDSLRTNFCALIREVQFTRAWYGRPPL